MKIRKIKVQNFRLLKDTFIDLEDDLSLIIGKNNCGKTSLLLILEKFLGNKSSQNNFSFDDFNTDFKDTLKKELEAPLNVEDLLTNDFPFLGISMKIFIDYDDKDNLANIGNKVMMDLDPENHTVVLAFEYSLSEDKFNLLKREFEAFCAKNKDKKTKPELLSYLKDKHSDYFKISKRSLEYNPVTKKENDSVFTDLIKEKIQIDKIINFKLISARRKVSNKDSDKALSSLSAKIYNQLDAAKEDDEVIERFKDALTDTDNQLDGIYSSIFEEIIDDVRNFGGLKQDDSIIKIVSSLQHRELLEENTTVRYDLTDPDHSLPENYNGLGYMNLISMIFEIKILLNEFCKRKEEKPSDINLLFIEEPEAHTHPQMQYIFIKNIKSLLARGIKRKDGKTGKLQTILSTHSSHIVAESDFDDIKYFKKENSSVVSKNLKDLEDEYASDNQAQHYKFLKQYLTLNRAELFFAEKVIFIEGDTERVILPAMMKKLDQEDMVKELETGLASSLPLLSQHISIIDVGNYSHVFEKFIDFIGIKSLIITDIDSIKTEPIVNEESGEIEKTTGGEYKLKEVKCPVSNGTNAGNSSLAFFYGEDKNLSDIISLGLDEKTLKKDIKTKEWVSDKTGHLVCAYQSNESNADGLEYHARSFEDSFFHINKPFFQKIILDQDGKLIKGHPFTSLTNKHLKVYIESKDTTATYNLADIGVGSKPTLAMEILLNSENEIKSINDKDISIEFVNWETPSYIKEGLQWLKQD